MSRDLPDQPLKSPFQEAFARERAGGCTLWEAARRAGYTPSEKNMKKVERKPHVQRRINEIHTLNRVQAGVTVEKLTDELDEAIEKAHADGQVSAAVSAIQAKAKLHGLWVDRRQDSKTHYVVSDEPIQDEDEWANKYGAESKEVH